LPREEWAKPREESRINGVAAQTIEAKPVFGQIKPSTRPCVRVLNHDIWRSVAISVLMNKRRERFSGKEKQSPAKGGIVSQERIEIRSFCRGCVGQTECRQLDR
jgi:hypothetical protein